MLGFGNVSLAICCLYVVLITGGTLKLPKECGNTNVEILGDRIVGGRAAIKGEFPWQVSLRYRSFFIPSSHLCGAAVLNEWWVITAAHCIFRRSERNLGVVVGMHNQMDQFLSHPVDKLVMHAEFDPETFFNDIALIKVKDPLPTDGPFVRAVCLPSPGEKVEGLATASGWGATYEDGSGSSVLRSVQLPIVPQPICENIYGKRYYSPSVMLCAGYPQGGRDTCQGDSGGPLVQERMNRSVLVGLVSSGVGCARPNLPGIYTRIPYFVNWIHQNTD